MSDYMDESYSSADQVIKDLAAQGHDYSAHREEIARVFDEYLFNGNWDSCTEIDLPDVQELRFIQEDEYDQHMDNDPDKPEWDDMLGYMAGHYVWFA
ncbi:hypothetical protein D3C87_588420 [compost metagenome]